MHRLSWPFHSFLLSLWLFESTTLVSFIEMMTFSDWDLSTNSCLIRWKRESTFDNFVMSTIWDFQLSVSTSRLALSCWDSSNWKYALGSYGLCRSQRLFPIDKVTTFSKWKPLHLTLDHAWDSSFLDILASMMCIPKPNLPSPRWTQDQTWTHC